MPKLTDEYLDVFLDMLEHLNNTENIVLLQCDVNSWVIAEIWHYPERKERDPDNEYEIYPIAKLLTEEDVVKLSMEGQKPKLPQKYKVGK